MCLILFAFNAHPRYKLILAANRDEFYARPTAPAAYWADAPDIFAGRDLAAGGTWLGVTKTGRFAAITNFRNPSAPQGTRSRGHLVSEFLREKSSAGEYLQTVKVTADEYSGFNLLVGNFGGSQSKISYFSNQSNDIVNLSSGIYGLSNHLLDTPWHKIVSGKQAFSEAVSSEEVNEHRLFEILADDAQANDDDLPETGVGLERERLLSPLFIKTENYGTRCSTVLLIDNDGQIFFEERSFAPNSSPPEITFKVSKEI